MPSSTASPSPTKLGGGFSSQRSNTGGSVSPAKPSSAAASRAGTPLGSNGFTSASKPSTSATPVRHIPPGCQHLSSLLHLNAATSSSKSASSPTKIKSEDGDDSSTNSFDTLPAATRSYLKRYIAGLRWGAQIRTGYVKMMDDEEKDAELAKWGQEVARATKQGKQLKKRRKLDYPQCHTCQADMLRPFICLECAFTGCFSPPIDDDPTSITRTAADSHMIQHLRTKKHALAFDLMYGHVFCADCNDFVQDPLLQSIQRHETCRVNQNVVGQQYGPAKTTVETLFPPSDTAAAMAKFYETDTSSVTCRVPRGLRNMGATCYMNVIIQAFLHNPLLRNYFLSDRHNPSLCNGAKTCLACEMDKIFSEFYSSDPGALAGAAPGSGGASSTASAAASAAAPPGAIVAASAAGGSENGASGPAAKGPHGPTSFLYCIWVDQASSELGQAGQHDAHELFISALNSIHTALTSRALERASLPSFAYDHSDATNLLFDHFEGGGGSGHQSEDEGMGGHGGTPMGLGGGAGGGGGVAGCPCVVHRTFAGQLQSDVTCQRCGKVNTTRDPMLDLSLDVRPESMRRRDANDGGVNGSHVKSKLATAKPAGLNGSGANGDAEQEQHLTICLQRYCSEEKLGNNDYACTACGGSASATKQLSLYRLPPVLCIQLKRFEHTSAAAKIDTKVRFPVVLDVRQFSTAEIRAPDENAAAAANDATSSKDSGLLANPDPEAYLYDLFTVVVHEGSMNTGHYTNFSKWRGSWYRFDDDKVHATSEAHVLQARAYQLCYRRRLLKNVVNSHARS
ncbi:related to UBP8-Ubiquitin-specific protease component of the SAGA complex [Sporisorium reilianum f. sp. reilianum]|uniref:Related to UBP8-Ubiquitin-specific protease component of the SAGA complex n=1 Tax=Sporisorium reilianum f. sp. reilianum TaxID=72559 RepID=A0A2N8U8G7_9BASI|nr:related to UBP8-Ubiquitin-specific protease component of the SAGA complex [Sporisorium reilianum f. sp. reilianum]